MPQHNQMGVKSVSIIMIIDYYGEIYILINLIHHYGSVTLEGTPKIFFSVSFLIFILAVIINLQTPKLYFKISILTHVHTQKEDSISISLNDFILILAAIDFHTFHDISVWCGLA